MHPSRSDLYLIPPYDLIIMVGWVQLEMGFRILLI